MPKPRSDLPYRRDYEMEKPDSPPRPATEPKGAEASTQTDKTLTDPATGEPNPGGPDPARQNAPG